MTRGKKLKNLATKSLVIMGLWTIVILLISSITLLSSLQEGAATSVSQIIIFELFCISPWILFTPLLIKLAREYRFEKDKIIPSLAIHLLAIAVIFSLHSIVQSYAVSIYYDVVFSWEYVQRDFLGFIDMRVMLYAGILMGVYAIDFQKKSREISMNESRLRAELSEAKFHALLNQIQPDFLLNSIESIKQNMDKGEEHSEEILTEFSDLLRIMLSNAKKDEVTVREDLKAYHLYLSILKKRLDQDISVESQVDEDCYEVLIPSFMLLIPVLEKIVDSLNNQTGKLQSVSYQAHHIDDKTQLELTITGENIPSGDVPEILQKVGLPQIVEKFQSKYGEDIQFKTSTGSNVICTTFMIPFIPAEKKNQPTEISNETAFVN